MANPLVDVIKNIFSGNQTDFNALSKQFEMVSSQLQQPNLIPQKTQQQPIQPPQSTQSLQLQKLPKQSKQTTSSDAKKAQSTKKPLTAKTLESATEPQSFIPILPYTPQGIAELVKQGKITPLQAQQILEAFAMQDLSIENWLAQIKQNIEKLPEEFEKKMNKVEDKMEKAYNELTQNLNKQIEVQKKYADKHIELIEKHLNWVQQVFLDLMKEKPNLEPDKWTLFGRQLAMALGSISALAHPGYAPYFYMAIPQIVQYWQNEDMYNFEKAMKKFELALKLAGTQLDFYNQIMEHNLAILEKQKEKELLPLTITGQLLMEKYHNFADTYNKMAVEHAKLLSDRIAHQLSAIKTDIVYRHYKDWREIQELAKKIELERLNELKRHNRVMEGIRNLMAKITGERLNLTKMEKFYPMLFPDKVMKMLHIQDPQLAYQILATYALYGPEKGFAKLQEIISEGSFGASSDKIKKDREADIPLGEGAEDFPIWW